ncbi:1214_t:CDS:2 [Ambispora gerdemannii]|uniref:1214_t:CDS:1 n=1 Tax=Ambispora gerdemannii TaxID=144530 RepID=A0A9N9FNH0_9GLOM|nr:1214_t:CDS:2 [Ambispora gerdemannii]
MEKTLERTVCCNSQHKSHTPKLIYPSTNHAYQDSTSTHVQSTNNNEFQDDTGNPFFIKNTSDGRIELTLNMDWYTSYKYQKHRTCAPIYLTILNLPRNLRYRKENLLLVGIVPGFKKPDSDHFQIYLQPLVLELLQL